MNKPEDFQSWSERLLAKVESMPPGDLLPEIVAELHRVKAALLLAKMKFDLQGDDVTLTMIEDIEGVPFERSLNDKVN